MAREANFTASDKIFVGEDKTLYYTVYNDDVSPAVPLDMSATGLIWIARTSPLAADALITKELGSGLSIVGVFNVDPLLNTQKVKIQLNDTDTVPDSGAIIAPGSYWCSLKRTDDGFETVLAYGTLVLLGATAYR